MLKFFYLFLLLNICFFNSAKCERSDTTILYFKFNTYAYESVPNIDKADFVRFIMPPDSGESKYNVEEYYKTGKLKLVGKYDEDYSPENAGHLSGKCITYFPSGKKESIANYEAGRKNGEEYLYYPNGKLYCVKNHILPTDIYHPIDVKYVECYDSTGNVICSQGKGKWIVYNSRFNIIKQGPIKKGRFDGDWIGITQSVFPTKYTIMYEDGNYISGTGYDKDGKAFYFRDTLQTSLSIIKFIIPCIESFENMKGFKKYKAALDSVTFSFIIEKDGNINNAKLLDCNQPELISLFKSIIGKTPKMLPMAYYGITVRSEVNISYKLASSFVNNIGAVRLLLFNEKMFP